jgi:hypothetical protein
MRPSVQHAIPNESVSSGTLRVRRTKEMRTKRELKVTLGSESPSHSLSLTPQLLQTRHIQKLAVVADASRRVMHVVEGAGVDANYAQWHLEHREGVTRVQVEVK